MKEFSSLMANEVKCPKCGSTQITANKKGFSLGKAVAGTVAVGPLGALAGVHGSSKIEITCLSCGNFWNPKVEADQIRNGVTIQTTSFHLLKEDWHRDFVSAYENGNRALANSILQLNDPTTFARRGVDRFYNDLPKSETFVPGSDSNQQNGILMIAVVVVVILIIILISKIF
ncbi:hypothetical protein [Dyadobacter linearis]|nr:hypothetical protein [Dyadobacter sp. CECT 9623]